MTDTERDKLADEIAQRLERAAICKPRRDEEGEFDPFVTIDLDLKDRDFIVAALRSRAPQDAEVAVVLKGLLFYADGSKLSPKGNFAQDLRVLRDRTFAIIERLEASRTPAPSQEPVAERISFPRWWIQQACDQLFAMKKLPSGALGDWAFEFREQLKDALEKPAATHPLVRREKIAEIVYNARRDWIVQPKQPFKENASKTEQEYCFRIADAILALQPTPAAPPVVGREALERALSVSGVCDDAGWKPSHLADRIMAALLAHGGEVMATEPAAAAEIADLVEKLKWLSKLDQTDENFGCIPPRYLSRAADIIERLKTELAAAEKRNAAMRELLSLDELKMMDHLQAEIERLAGQEGSHDGKI
jgi:hypothetical protein